MQWTHSSLAQQAGGISQSSISILNAHHTAETDMNHNTQHCDCSCTGTCRAYHLSNNESCLWKTLCSTWMCEHPTQLCGPTADGTNRLCEWPQFHQLLLCIFQQTTASRTQAQRNWCPQYTSWRQLRSAAHQNTQNSRTTCRWFSYLVWTYIRLRTSSRGCVKVLNKRLFNLRHIFGSWCFAQFLSKCGKSAFEVSHLFNFVAISELAIELLN